MLISLEFIPSLLKDNEKLQTVYEIESFTGMAHDDAKIIFVFAKTNNVSITLTKDVKKEDFVQMDKHPTNCITIDKTGNSAKRNENYEKLIDDMKEEIATLKEKLKTEIEIEPEATRKFATTMFGKPIVILSASDYNRMIVKIKEYDKLKDASNRAEIMYEHNSEEYKKQIEALQKYKSLYKDLLGSIENTLTQFK